MSIPAMQPEIDALFTKLEKRGCKSICLTSDKVKAGTTSLSIALYERYLLAGYKTLYVDLNLQNPSFTSSELLVDLIEHKKQSKVFSGIAAPNSLSEQISFRNPYSVQTLLAKWYQDYQRVIFDTTSLQLSNQNRITAPVIAEVSDACILVVKGGATKSEGLQQSLWQLQSTDCPFICIVLNQHKLKTFAEAIMASSFVSPWLPKKLKKRIQKTLLKHALFKHVI